MNACAVVGAAAFALLIAVGSSYATRQRIVVAKVGWGQELGSGNSLYSEGARVVNQSNQDAYGVTVTIKDSQRGGAGLGAYDLAINEIPAGKSFVVAEGPFGNRGRTYVTKIGATVHVHRWSRQTDADQLLRVSDVRIDRKKYAVSAVITNSLPHPIKLNPAQAFAVVYNSSGRIIGGGQSLTLHDSRTGPTLKPGGHLAVSIQVAARMSRVARAQVSATP